MELDHLIRFLLLLAKLSHKLKTLGRINSLFPPVGTIRVLGIVIIDGLSPIDFLA